MCQRLDAPRLADEAVWTMKFSLDGQFLAAAGGSESTGVVRVWKVRPPTARDHDWAHLAAHAEAPTTASPAFAGAGAGAGRPGKVGGMEIMGRPVLHSVPFREYVGHEMHVVDLAWSRTNLLLSASMDKYVRLWHVSRQECLHKFQHPDCVTSVAFHPSEDNYFLTGCFDKKLRVWGLHSGRVVLWQATLSMITSVAFSPDARLVVAGLYNGVCTFYLTDGLRYHTQVECRNRKGRARGGRKVTGLQFINGGTELLVSTNDSRCRLINMDDFSMSFKYKGHVNKNMQIHATFDPSGEFIISGSEDHRVYVWRTRHDDYSPTLRFGYDRHRNGSYESFPGSDDKADAATTVAVFAPQPALVTARPPSPGSSALLGSFDQMIIVAATSKGTIRVFENLPVTE